MKTVNIASISHIKVTFFSISGRPSETTQLPVGKCVFSLSIEKKITTREQLIRQPSISYHFASSQKTLVHHKIFFKITFSRIVRNNGRNRINLNLLHFTYFFYQFQGSFKCGRRTHFPWFGHSYELFNCHWSTLYLTINRWLIVYWQCVKMIQTMQMAALGKLPLQTIAQNKRSLWGGIAQSRANFVRRRVS